MSKGSTGLVGGSTGLTRESAGDSGERGADPAHLDDSLGSQQVLIRCTSTVTGVWECGEWLDTLHPDAPVGLDVETTGLDMFADDFAIRTVQLSDGHVAWVLRCEEHHATETIKSLLRNPSLRFVTHGTYDSLCLRAAWGIDLTGRVIDSHLLSRLVHPSDEEEHGLKPLSARWLQAPQLQAAEDALRVRWREQARAQGVTDKRGKNQLASWGFANCPTDDPAFVRYAALDAAACVRLAPALVRVLGTGRNLVPFEMRLADIANGMKVRGIQVDTDHAESLLGDRERGIEMLEDDIEERTGVGARSPRLVWWLADQGFEFEREERTIGGRPSLSKDFIDAQVERAGADHDVYRVLRAKRDLMRLTNEAANLQGFLKFADSKGRLHPNIQTLRARTARMSITAPALQTLKKGSTLRPCLIADPGRVMISVDLAQIELRVAAALSGDKNLSGPILAGEDLHSDTARRIFGGGFTDEQRKVAKMTNFASLYGGGAKTIAAQAGIPIIEAQTVVTRWREAYPRVAAMAASLSRRETITTPTGRVIPLDQTRPFAAMNYMIQSTARDLFAIAVIRIADLLGLEDSLVLLVHDEVLLQAPEADAEQVLADVLGEMQLTLYGIPITASGEILGPRWGS